MVEAWIIAGAIVASAILLTYYLRPKTDEDLKIRMVARSLVRAIEKRSQWDNTISTEHIKRARVTLVLQELFPSVDRDWLDVIIEEAVFDMEASHGTIGIRSTDGSTGDDPGTGARTVGESDSTDIELDPGDRNTTWVGTSRDGWSETGDVDVDEDLGEDLPIPSAE
jgi:hypothetical protein